jgi:copper transport protein
LTRRTRLLAVAATVFAGAGAAPAAWGHARLVSADPGEGAVLARAPARVTLKYDDTVRVLGGTTVIRNADRKSIVAGKPRRSGRTIVIPLRRLEDGDYTVKARVLSDDGHTVERVYAFAVGAGRPPPSAALEAGGGPSATNVISRWLFFAGLLVAVGTALFLRLAWRPALRAAAVTSGGETPLWALAFAGFFLAFLGASGLVPHHGAGTTRFGLFMEIGGVLGIAGATLAAIAIVERRVGWLVLVAALLLLPVPTLAGHALDPGELRPLNVVADVLHVAAAALWIGGLLALAAALPRVLRELDTEHRARFTSVLVPRLSAAALVSVAVIAVTGLIRALFELSAVSQLWSSGYGRALIVKTGLLAALVMLGWINRSRLVPSGRTGELRRNVAVELALLATVVGAVAFLTDLVPGRRLAKAIARPAAPSRPVAPPPKGALVLGSQAGSLAIGLARLADGRLQATVLGPDDRGVDRLPVVFVTRGRRTDTFSCGPGCYRSPTRFRGRGVAVDIGRPPRVVFVLPERTRSAAALVRRARRAFGGLSSVVIHERLASSPTAKVTSTWRIEAPNRLAYVTSGGARAVVIGSRRWDRLGKGPWERSAQTPLRLPGAWWGPASFDASLLGWARTVRGKRARVVSFYDPKLPAWFEVAIDPATAVPLELKMTAAAHFMRHRYTDFNRPLRIVPPSS